jgi:hypothetical protein
MMVQRFVHTIFGHKTVLVSEDRVDWIKLTQQKLSYL